MTAFCSPFDEQLAERGPPAAFLLDPEGRLRFDAEWTRDLYTRAPTDPPRAPTWTLARDRDSGYVQLVLLTSPALAGPHPRLQFRAFSSREEAEAALRELGRPPIARDPW